MEMIPLPDVAQMLDVPITKVRQYIRDRKLMSMDNEDGVRCVPALFLMQDGDSYHLVDDVDGTATTLIDGGFSPDEACQWLISENDLLHGDVPLEVIRDGGYHRVNRVAAMMAF